MSIETEINLIASEETLYRKRETEEKEMDKAPDDR